MKTFRFYYDKDKEEKWINEMAQKGYAFENFFLGVYTFKPCIPGAYYYQIDLLDNDKVKGKEFLDLMEDTDVEIVDRWFRWVFLRRNAELGEFQLYSDNDSKASQYERLGRFYLIFMLIELSLLPNLINSAFRMNHFNILFVFFTILIFLFVLLFAIFSIKSSSKAKALRKGM